MSWIQVLMATAVSLSLAGFAFWLIGPLSDVLLWLQESDDNLPLDADDLREARAPLVSR